VPEEAEAPMPRQGWFGQRRKRADTGADEKLKDVPTDLWETCPKCEGAVYRKDLERNLKVCPKCGYHFRLRTDERLAITVDEGSFVAHSASAEPYDPLQFPEYAEKIRGDMAKTGLSEAVVTGDCTIGGVPTVLAVMDMAFRGGSMGYEVGERIARAAEAAGEKRAPYVIFAASGGARMQESLISLMQMPKTAGAIGWLQRAGLACITVITDMTYAGVLASYVSLGDIIIAEPGAAVGFTGPRVIEIALKIKIPPAVQTVEFQYEHGLIDAIVERKDMRDVLTRILRWCSDAVPAPTASAADSTDA
jgi:acetyl-CoA carboxylase carboxyl transferase subunit beta